MMHEHERERVELSPAGEARRDEMLSALTAEMGRVHTVRRRVRHGVVAACVLVVAGVVVSIIPPTSTAPIQPSARGPAPMPYRWSQTIRTVRTEQTELSHVRVYETTSRSRIRVIDDAGLVAALHAAGRPAGVIRVEGRVMLTAAVTDEGASPGL